MLDWIEEKKQGDWEVRHFELSKEDALMSFISYQHRMAHPGKYTQLVHATRGTIMSDTPAEMRDLSEFRYALHVHPKSRVHINGLGLGICVKMALDAGCTVEVVEIDSDVIELVGTQLLKLYPKSLTIIHADCLTYKPPKGSRFEITWHDIWDSIDTENWNEYKLLNRRYGRLTDWQGSWGSYEIKRMQRQEREEERWMDAIHRMRHNPLEG